MTRRERQLPPEWQVYARRKPDRRAGLSLRAVALGGGAFAAIFVGGMAITQGLPFSLPVLAAGGGTGPAPAAQFSCTVRSITDGDTLRCADGTRIRISGINAKEKDGTCNPGAPCPTASPEEATAALSRLASGQTITCEAVGTTYDRIAAFCTNGEGVDLSCGMMNSGAVARWDRYWNGHRC